MLLGVPLLILARLYFKMLVAVFPYPVVFHKCYVQFNRRPKVKMVLDVFCFTNEHQIQSSYGAAILTADTFEFTKAFDTCSSESSTLPNAR